MIYGQQVLQASSDPLLGWTTIDSRPYYVRQLDIHKGEIPVADLPPAALTFYAWACGRALGRAHARGGDAATIAAYLGGGGVFGRAMVDWADAYGKQTIQDHASFAAAIKRKRLPAAIG